VGATISKTSPAEWANASRRSGASVLCPERVPTSPASKERLLPSTLIALFLFSQLFYYHAFNLYTVTPDKLLFGIILLLCARGAVTHRLRSTSFSGPEVCMLLFAILCTVSYVITRPDAGSIRYKWLTTLFNFIVYPFAIYLFAKRTRYNAAQTLWLLRAIVCIGIYLAFTASFEHFGINALVFPKYIVDPHVGIQFGRARGPLVGSNPMGEWLILVYLAACLVIPFTSRLSRLALQCLSVLITMGIYFTFTRGVWLSFAAVLLLTAIQRGKFGAQSRLMIVVLIVAFFAGVCSKLSFQRETLFSRRQNTIDYRIANNITTFNMGMAHFLTGVGYGSFLQSWKNYFSTNQKELARDLTDGNHNTYLGLFADLGFPGIALYTALFGYLLRECMRIRRLLGPGAQFEKRLALSSIALLIVVIMEAMESDLRFNPTLNTTTFLLVGITASIQPKGLSTRDQCMGWRSGTRLRK